MPSAADLAMQLVMPGGARSDLPGEVGILDIYTKSLQFLIHQFKMFFL